MICPPPWQVQLFGFGPGRTGRKGKIRQRGLVVLERDLKRGIGTDERQDDVNDSENAGGWS